MATLRALKIISIILAGLLAPFLVILVPFSLLFVMLSLALGRHTEPASTLKPRTKSKTILFIITTAAIAMTSIWMYLELETGFGNDESIVSEVIGTSLFALIGLGTITAYLKSPK